ncbi:hypothetical protein OH76DRAFT_377727 [Lentinus brumalis]|uniref:Uncharacterized protein n=1 Tax=Lentinus brumalis TaxID=2498619 RepID=A0A371DUW3_9APHY|nr:hypothetical protein OH76DRAFT_377727 [Polyporus brumalis]
MFQTPVHLAQLARQENSDAEVVDQFRRDTSSDSQDWKWHDEASQQNWELASPEWQAFNKRWREYRGPLHRAGTVLPLNIPRSHCKLSFRTKEESVLVRESYVYTRNSIWEIAALMSRTSGALIRGDPGVGKTAFLYYFHVSLLRDGHVVLLYMQSNPPLLFLHDKVYSRKSTAPPSETELYSLPTSENGFIWSLFDVDTSTQDLAYPPLLALCALCFPVQAPPPKANISWDWAEERFAYLGGLPLWTRQELYDAFPLHEQFDSYREDLQSALDAWPQRQFLGSSGVMIALRSAYGEERPDSVESMIETMLDIAIDAVGRVPLDVYAAMMDPATEKARFEATLEVSCPDLKRILEAFPLAWRIRVPVDPHLIVSSDIERIHRDGALCWTLAFRSRSIAKTVAERLVDEWQGAAARKTLSLFMSVPEARPITGRLLEPFAHRALTETVGRWPWTLRAMIRNDDDPLTFRACKTPAMLSFPKFKRKRVQYRGLPDTLLPRSYYTPVDPSFPLIDAVTVDIDEKSWSATLWLLQMATTDMYGDLVSRHGWRVIRMLVSLLRRQLQSMGPPREGSEPVSSPSVKIQHVLVSTNDPVEGDSFMYKMPPGWDQDIGQVDHPGDIYLLQVPVEVCA